MQINFSQIIIEGLEGQEVADLRMPLGNHLYFHSTDIDGVELGRKIYKSEGVIEVSSAEHDIITKAVETLYPSYVIRKAVEGAFSCTK